MEPVGCCSAKKVLSAGVSAPQPASPSDVAASSSNDAQSSDAGAVAAPVADKVGESLDTSASPDKKTRKKRTPDQRKKRQEKKTTDSEDTKAEDTSPEKSAGEEKPTRTPPWPEPWEVAFVEFLVEHLEEKSTLTSQQAHAFWESAAEFLSTKFAGSEDSTAPPKFDKTAAQTRLKWQKLKNRFQIIRKQKESETGDLADPAKLWNSWVLYAKIETVLNASRARRQPDGEARPADARPEPRAKASPSRQTAPKQSLLKPIKEFGYYSHSAIVDRPKFTWPNGTKLAVYFIVNVEHFSFGELSTARISATAPPPTAPDVLNHSWRDYGNRVGIWRLLSVFDDLNLPLQALVNSTIYDHAPEIMTALRTRAKDRGLPYEVVAHGRTNSELQRDMDLETEKEMIRSVTATIAKHEGGQHPRGWLSPGIAPSANTPTLLARNKYNYTLDFAHDDQPTWLNTAPLVTVPYGYEINDHMAFRGLERTADEFERMIVDEFEEKLLGGPTSGPLAAPAVFVLALHTYWMGQPHRVRALRRTLEHIAAYRDRVWFATPGQIAEHFKTTEAGKAPATHRKTTSRSVRPKGAEVKVQATNAVLTA